MSFFQCTVPLNCPSVWITFTLPGTETFFDNGGCQFRTLNFFLKSVAYRLTLGISRGLPVKKSPCKWCHFKMPSMNLTHITFRRNFYTKTQNSLARCTLNLYTSKSRQINRVRYHLAHDSEARNFASQKDTFQLPINISKSRLY